MEKLKDFAAMFKGKQLLQAESGNLGILETISKMVATHKGKILPPGGAIFLL